MELYIENETHDVLIFLDTEFDKKQLVQIACFIFHKVKDSIYELRGSYNSYISIKKLNPFFVSFTGITEQFLKEHGANQDDAAIQLYEFLLSNLNLNEHVLLISHGMDNDIKILKDSDFRFLTYFEHFDTLKALKRLFPNKEKYSLEEMSKEEGWFLSSPHDAFYDAAATIPIFCKIKKEGYNEDYEKNKNH